MSLQRMFATSMSAVLALEPAACRPFHPFISAPATVGTTACQVSDIEVTKQFRRTEKI